MSHDVCDVNRPQTLLEKEDGLFRALWEDHVSGTSSTDGPH
jgi:hypothetical protein